MESEKIISNSDDSIQNDIEDIIDLFVGKSMQSFSFELQNKSHFQSILNKFPNVNKSQSEQIWNFLINANEQKVDSDHLYISSLDQIERLRHEINVLKQEKQDFKRLLEIQHKNFELKVKALHHFNQNANLSISDTNKINIPSSDALKSLSGAQAIVSASGMVPNDVMNQPGANAGILSIECLDKMLNPMNKNDSKLKSAKSCLENNDNKQYLNDVSDDLLSEGSVSIWPQKENFEMDSPVSADYDQQFLLLNGSDQMKNDQQQMDSMKLSSTTKALSIKSSTCSVEFIECSLENQTPISPMSCSSPEEECKSNTRIFQFGKYDVTFKQSVLGLTLRSYSNGLNYIVVKCNSNFTQERVCPGSIIIAINREYVLDLPTSKIRNIIKSKASEPPLIITFFGGSTIKSTISQSTSLSVDTSASATLRELVGGSHVITNPGPQPEEKNSNNQFIAEIEYKSQDQCSTYWLSNTMERSDVSSINITNLSADNMLSGAIDETLTEYSSRSTTVSKKTDNTNANQSNQKKQDKKSQNSNNDQNNDENTNNNYSSGGTGGNGNGGGKKDKGNEDDGDGKKDKNNDDNNDDEEEEETEDEENKEQEEEKNDENNKLEEKNNSTSSTSKWNLNAAEFIPQKQSKTKLRKRVATAPKLPDIAEETEEIKEVAEKKQYGKIKYETNRINKQQVLDTHAIYISNKDIATSSWPLYIFGENDIDKKRPKGSQRRHSGGLASVLGYFDTSVSFGITTTFYEDQSVKNDFDAFKIIIDNDFGELLKYLKNGHDIIVPSPNKQDLHGKYAKSYWKTINNEKKQVIFHNIGTGIARIPFHYIEYIQQKFDILGDKTETFINHLNGEESMPLMSDKSVKSTINNSNKCKQNKKQYQYNPHVYLSFRSDKPFLKYLMESRRLKRIQITNEKELKSYLHKSVAIQVDGNLKKLTLETSEKNIKLINYDFLQINAQSNMYAALQLKHESKNKYMIMKKNKNVYLFTAQEIFHQFVKSQSLKNSKILPKSPRNSKRFKREMNAGHSITKELSEILTNKKKRQKFLAKFPWETTKKKIGIYGRDGNQNKQKFTLSIEKMTFVDRIINYVKSNGCNGIKLVPFIMFSRNGYSVHFAWIVEMDIDNHIAISFRINKKKQLTASGIHLDKQKMKQQHQLIDPYHKCSCFDQFKTSINDLRIFCQRDTWYQDQQEYLKLTQKNDKYFTIISKLTKFVQVLIKLFAHYKRQKCEGKELLTKIATHVTSAQTSMETNAHWEFELSKLLSLSDDISKEIYPVSI